MNAKLINEEAWEAATKLLRLAGFRSTEQKDNFFHAAYELLVRLLADYARKITQHNKVP